MNIGIVGLGLIGGSLGLDLRSLGHQVFGVSRQVATCELAIARGAVDQASPDLDLLKGVEVIFLCTPLGSIRETVVQLRPQLGPETILTDVGSVKLPIVEAIAPLWPHFLGGHPMAGTAATGIVAAQTALFAGRPYVLTPTATTPPFVLDRVMALVRSLQAQVYQCTPAAHDRAVAWISHLPVIVSASLIAACETEPEPEILELARQFASSGFRDTSRVGGGNPELGRMMAQYNREALLRSLQSYHESLEQMIRLIQQEDWPQLQQALEQTQAARPRFLDSLQGLELG